MHQGNFQPRSPDTRYARSDQKMSIFGEGVCRGPNIDEVNEILSGYAKTDYVDVQDGLRVLKAGDTMSGDLDMGGQLVRGLPRDLRSYKGDEATSWNQVVKTASSAFEAAVDRRKPLITVWAEENEPIAENEYEWSFGKGASVGNTDRGYPMLAAGRILRMGLAATTSGSAPAAASVNVVVNGVENMYIYIYIYIYIQP